MFIAKLGQVRIYDKASKGFLIQPGEVQLQFSLDQLW